MIKFNRAAADQSLSTPDSPVVTLPNSDWSIVFVIDLIGLLTGDNPQYMLSTGTFGSAGSLNILYNTSGAAATNLRSRVQVYADTNTNGTTSVASTEAIANGTWLYAVSRAGGALTIRRCPILSAAPTNGSAVIADGSSTGSQYIKELNGSGLKIGSRLDDAANRKCDQALSRMGAFAGTVTDLQLARMAYGELPSDVGLTPMWFVRMSSVTDVADLGPNALPFTIAGSPTTSAEPAYGYTGGPVTPEPEVNTITVSPVTANRILQRASGVADLDMSLTYTGTLPTAIDYQLYNASGDTVVKAWAPLTSAAIGSGAATGKASIPAGPKRRIALRSRNGATVLATSPIGSQQVAAGVLGGVIGSSSASRLFDSFSGTGYAVDPDTSVLSGASPTWSAMSTTGAGALLAAKLRERAGVSVGLLNYGVSGTKLAEWLDKNSTRWLNFAAGVAAAGGKLEFCYITVGSNDAESGNMVSRAAHLANMRALAANVRELTGQPNLPILWSGSNSRPGLNAIRANRLRMAENDIGDDPFVWHVQTTDLPIMSDLVHLTAEGFVTLVGTRTPYVLGEALFGTGRKLRGPKIVQFGYSGNEISVDVQHRNGTDMLPSSGATGFVVSDSSGAPAITSDTRTSAARRLLKLDRAVVGTPTVTYQAGGGPDVASPVFDNGSVALPMHVETDLVAVEAGAPADTTAPTFTGTIAVSNITSSGATLTAPVATDDTGVVGYQVSTDAGANFTNTASNVVTLTGLPAASTINAQMRAYDAAGNYSAPLSRSFTTLAAQDTTAPVFPSGAAVSITSITNNGATLTVPAATDAVGVAGYQVSVNGGTSYNNAPGRVIPLTGLPAGTAISARVRAYDAAGNRSAPLSANFTTLSNTPTPENPAFTRSQSRTIDIKAAPLTFSGGAYWNLANPRRPVGSIDPNATIDITFNWTEVLADIQDTIADVQFDIIGVANKGAFRDGAFATIFVSNATGTPSITCRITTASTPPRVEDRTVYLTVEQQ